MPAKKTPQKGSKKQSGGNMKLTDKERTALKKGAEAAKKKHGFKTPEEYIAYTDKKRGY